MPEAEALPPTNWYTQGDMDVQAADILLAEDGPLPVVAFHIQQAVEKYLKGFLISTGWPLRRIHDLEILAQEAIARDADFAPFLAPCQRITEYYIETRYPLGIHTLLQPETVQADLETTRALIELILQKQVRGQKAEG
jgi:HEPN domain-containing protein